MFPATCRRVKADPNLPRLLSRSPAACERLARSLQSPSWDGICGRLQPYLLKCHRRDLRNASGRACFKSPEGASLRADYTAKEHAATTARNGRGFSVRSDHDVVTNAIRRGRFTIRSRPVVRPTGRSRLHKCGARWQDHQTADRVTRMLSTQTHRSHEHSLETGASHGAGCP